MNTRRKKTDSGPPDITNTKPKRAEVKQKQLRVLLLSILAIAVLCIGGIVYYQTYMAPYRRVVITVDDTVVRMDYFLKRARLSGNDVETTVQQLVYEQVVKLEGKKSGIAISDAEVDRALRAAAASASADNVTPNPVLTEGEYSAWFNEELKTYDMSAAQYREMVGTNLLAIRIQEALRQNLPTKGEQVHLHVIVLGSLSDVAEAKSRLESGETFAAVARDMSLDTQTKEAGGDVGWEPKGILPYDDVFFTLEVGKVSDPVMMDSSSPSTSQYLMFMVSEKDPERVIDEDAMQQLAYNAFYNWLNQQIEQHTVTYNLNEDTQAWITWQLSKIRS